MARVVAEDSLSRNPGVEEPLLGWQESSMSL